MAFIDNPTPEIVQEMNDCVFGKIAKPVVKFKTHMWLDVQASIDEEERTGIHKRIERPLPFVKLEFHGNKSGIYQRATEQDIRKYAREFAAYQEEIRHGRETPYEGWQDVGGSQSGQQHGSVGEPDERTRAVIVPQRGKLRQVRKAG